MTESVDYRDLNIYTDGCSKKNPRRGGIGVLFIFPNGDEKELSPNGYKQATNNQMEMKSCCIALKEALNFKRKWERIVIWTDSEYVCNHYKIAINKWANNKWFKDCGAPVSNSIIWKELKKNILKIKTPVEIRWIKGKSNRETKIVDRLAKKSAEKVTNLPIIYIESRKKTSKEDTEIGSIKMLGQNITLKIISGEVINRNLHKYRCQVVSKRNPYYQKIDFIYSKKCLRGNHTFYVHLNENQNLPQILKVIKEIK